ncbi:hypothetical protein [Arthrobacter sp. Y81]|nr:hypothetical protein [Arthrobacter sp. Y81]
MTSDEEKDPPVPADLEDSAKRVHHVQVAEERDHEAPADEPDA